MIKVWDYLKEYDLLRENILKIIDEVFRGQIILNIPKKYYQKEFC